MDLGRLGIWWSGGKEDGFVEAAAAMEDAGYGALWMSGGFRPGVMPRFAATLAATSRVVVASGIISVWLTPADEVAAAAAELETAHGGRFLLGLGVSHEPLLQSLGRTYERPVGQMISFLDELDGASPTVPPDSRVLAALGPRMLRISAERSLGAHPYFVPVEHTAVARETLGDGPLLAPEVAVVLEEDPSEARALARRYASVYLALPNYAGNLVRLGWSEEDLADGGSDRLIDAVIPWGPLDRVAARVGEHFDAGADHVCVQVVTADGVFPVEDYRGLAAALGG